MFPANELLLPTIGSLAVVGLAKNAGKTVVLGRLIEEALGVGRQVGVVSTGMDGERRDAIFGYRKPPIHVLPGMVVAGAMEGLAAATAGLEGRERTGLETPFGEIVVSRVEREGDVTLIGPRSVADLDVAVAALRQHGADLVLIDGSIDRRAVLAATVTEGTVLVVGASYHRDLTRVLDEARRVIRLLQLPQWTPPVEGGEHWQWPRQVVLVGPDREPRALALASVLGREEEMADLVRHHKAHVAVCPGAVSGRFLAALFHNGAAAGLTVVAEHGVRIFASNDELDAYSAGGGLLAVRTPVKLVGLAVNPVAPEGYRFSPRELRERVQALAPQGVPVFDALAD